MKDGGELQRKNMEAAARLAELSIESARNVIMLLAELARTLFRESGVGQDAAAASSEPRDVMTARTRQAERTMRLMVEGAQKIADIDAEARARFSRLLAEQLVSGNHDLMDAFQSYFRFLPAENGNAVRAIENAVAEGHGALAQMGAFAAAAGDNAFFVAPPARPVPAYPRMRTREILPALHQAEPRAY